MEKGWSKAGRAVRRCSLRTFAGVCHCWPGEQFAEEIDFLTQFIIQGIGLINFFGGDCRLAIEFPEAVVRLARGARKASPSATIWLTNPIC